jgi:hypothetical protein
MPSRARPAAAVATLAARCIERALPRATPMPPPTSSHAKGVQTKMFSLP